MTRLDAIRTRMETQADAGLSAEDLAALVAVAEAANNLLNDAAMRHALLEDEGHVADDLIDALAPLLSQEVQ